MKHLKLLISLLLFQYSIEAKIRLFSIHYNRPDFLELQWKAINKFLKEKDFEFIVVSDATDPDLKKQIEEIAHKYNFTCINFPQELHHTGSLIEQVKKYNLDGYNGSVRHCQIMQYILDNFVYDHNDLVGIMEGDIFPIRAFSMREMLQNYDFIGTVQTDRENKGIEFIWIGLTFLNPQHLPNKSTFIFDLTYYNGKIFLDSGGSTYYYLQNNPEVKVKKYRRVPIDTLPRTNPVQLNQLGYRPKEITFLQKMAFYQAEHPYVSIEFHFDTHFLHYSWSRNAIDSAKSVPFKEFLNSILTD